MHTYQLQKHNSWSKRTSGGHKWHQTFKDGVTHASYVPPLTKASLAVQNCVDQSHPRDLGSYSNWIS